MFDHERSQLLLYVHQCWQGTLSICQRFETETSLILQCGHLLGIHVPEIDIQVFQQKEKVTHLSRRISFLALI